MRASQVWPEVHRLRVTLADLAERFEEDQSNAPSWCKGWRVHDVLGHLVHLAEATKVAMASDMLRSGLRPQRALDRAARRLGHRPMPELAGRLRRAAGGRFHVPGSPAVVALGEVIVHGADALRPLGEDLVVPVTDVVPLLDLYWRIGHWALHAPPREGRRLVAVDADWARGRGPEVRGRAVDLLLLLANRQQVMTSLTD